MMSTSHVFVFSLAGGGDMLILPGRNAPAVRLQFLLLNVYSRIPSS